MKVLTKSRIDRKISDINDPGRYPDCDKNSKLDKNFREKGPHRHDTLLRQRRMKDRKGKVNARRLES
jgi:hypothetical protein